MRNSIYVGRSHDVPVNSHQRYPLKDSDVTGYGTLVKLNTDGELEVASSGDDFYGLVTEEMTGDGDEEKPLVEELSPEIEYYGLANDDMDQDDIGKEYNLTIDSDNRHVVDKDGGEITDGGDVTIMQIQEASFSGDYSRRPLIRFNNIQL